MSIIYTLYVKTHNITGLKYLGYTRGGNPYKYKGSGKVWEEHLIENGNNVSTQILVQSEEKWKIKFWGRYFSKEWNIVKSKEWANLIPETCGGLGNKPGHIHSIITRKRISKTLTGRKHTDEQRRINSLSKIGKPKTKEHAEKISKARKGMIFSNKHIQNIRFARYRQLIVRDILRESLKYYFRLDSPS